MSNKIPYKQDMPPKGGYPQLQVSRIKTWTPRPWAIAGAFITFLPIGYYLQKELMKKKALEQVADDEVRTCLEPLIKAENDRLLLWQLRRNREEENNLMKNVPGWETGTWFGEPVYKTNKNLDTWILPNRYEVYAHTRPLALTEITMLDQKSL